MEPLPPTLSGQHPLQPLADAIRFLSVDAIVQATEGHQGVPLGMAEIATALYAHHLKFDPHNPEWPDRDRDVLYPHFGITADAVVREALRCLEQDQVVSAVALAATSGITETATVQGE